MNKGSIIIIFIIAIPFLGFCVYGIVNRDIVAIICGAIFGGTCLAYGIYYLRNEMHADRYRRAGFDEDFVRQETELPIERKIREMEEYQKAHGLTYFTEETMHEKEKGKCPKCGISVEDGRIICKNCGVVILRKKQKKSVDDALMKDDTADMPAKDIITECPHCNMSLGTIVGDFCPHCGKRFR